MRTFLLAYRYIVHARKLGNYKLFLLMQEITIFVILKVSAEKHESHFFILTRSFSLCFINF